MTRQMLFTRRIQTSPESFFIQLKLILMLKAFINLTNYTIQELICQGIFLVTSAVKRVTAMEISDYGHGGSSYLEPSPIPYKSP